MKRWLIPVVLLLLAPAAALATPQFHLTVALQDIRAGRDGDALYYLGRAIQEPGLKPAELADAHEWRAFLHVKRGNLRAARADLDAAVAADKDSPLRLRARARFHLRNGDYRAALADMEQLMTRFETDAENYADLCEAQLGLGRRAEAIENCRRGVRVDPEHPRPKMLLRRAGGR
jgi:tetratricopeptide (TPR) repeat protein